MSEDEINHSAAGCVPYLCEQQASGIGTLSTRAPLSVPSGAESDRRVVDVKITHNIVLDSEIEAVDSFLPGFGSERQRTFGAASDGKRGRKWIPAKPARRVCLMALGSDVPLYEGPCDLKHASVSITGTACVLLLQLRLHSVEFGALGAMGKLLGEPVSYMLVSEGMTGALTTAPMPGGLPFGSAALADLEEEEEESEGQEAIEIKPRPGDLVVAIDGDDEVVGLVRSVAGERVTVSLDLGGEQVRTFASATIAVVHKLCGARGGAATGLNKLPASTPARLVLDTLLAALETDEISMKEEGLPVTKQILARIAEQAAEESALPEDP